MNDLTRELKSKVVLGALVVTVCAYLCVGLAIYLDDAVAPSREKIILEILNILAARADGVAGGRQGRERARLIL